MEQQPGSGKRLYGKRSLRVWWSGVSVLVLLLWGFPASADVSSAELFPIPDALRPSVAFWKKIFAEVEVTGGLLHDMNDPAIIYETLEQLPSNAQERQNAISGYRDYYQIILFTLASGKREDLSSDEARVLAMFRGKDRPEVFQEAAASMRFQGGMRERFMRGIIRSGAYRPDMERVFASFGLPVELTYLPHVESSFENRALSKVGAAGVWQIMPATGRRFLTVNGRVDERLDIQAATVAAAQIFQENYEQLGTWPLAITAYNHGLYGMKQAVEIMGTKDFGVIFQYYRGPLFGFASQNFYAEFLAAMEVAQNYRRYFGDIPFDSSVPFTTTAYYQPDSSSDEDRNTALSSLPPSSPPLPEPPAIEENKQASIPSPPEPRQSREIFPGEQSSAMLPVPVVTRPTRDTSVNDNRTTILVPNIAATQQLRESPAVEDKGLTVASSSLLPRQPRETGLQEARSSPPVLDTTARHGRTNTNDSSTAVVVPTSKYRVRSGDTLTTIAQRFHTTVAQLSALNHLPPRYMVKKGETLAIATPVSEVAMAEKPAPQVMAKAVVEDSTKKPAVDGATKKPEDAILRAIASKAVPLAPHPAAKPALPEIALAEKSVPHVVARATADDAAKKPAVDKTAKKPDATRTSASKVTPLDRAAKSVASEAPTGVVAARSPKGTTTRAVTPEIPRSVGASVAKAGSTKSATPEIPVPVTLASAAHAVTVKPVPANPIKIAPGKPGVPEVARSVPAGTSKSVSTSTSKLVVTRTPVTNDVPKPTMLPSVTKTPVSTRATTRRPNPKGA